jgi:outer membrane protein
VSVINTHIRAVLVTASLTLLNVTLAHSETLTGALEKAYNHNSELKSARANVRIADEGVAIAKTAGRPTISASLSGSYKSNVDGARQSGTSHGVTVRQALFDGFRAHNTTKSMEAQMLSARQSLRNSEQTVLFNSATAYLDVIRDGKIKELRKKNVSFFKEQLRSAKARFDVGEGTRTDVAQADSSRASAVSFSNAADAQFNSSQANYREIIGSEPKDLKAASPVAKLLPKTVEEALDIAASNHPVIQARKYQVISSLSGVKVAQGALLPTLGIEGGIKRTSGGQNQGGFSQTNTSDDASITLQLNVPIYQGGKAAAQVRQEKERLSQAEFNVDSANDSVRSAVVAAWGQYTSLKESLVANKQLVASAQLALNGVIEERKVGQRTTLDVLNSQSNLVSAQLSLVNADHGLVQASYAVLQATGQLSAEKLGLKVDIYDPIEHYVGVKDKWFGLRVSSEK